MIISQQEIARLYVLLLNSVQNEQSQNVSKCHKMSQMTENRPPQKWHSGPTKIPMGPQYRPCLPSPASQGSQSYLFLFSSVSPRRRKACLWFAESMGIHGSDVGDVWMDPEWILDGSWLYFKWPIWAQKYHNPTVTCTAMLQFCSMPAWRWKKPSPFGVDQCECDSHIVNHTRYIYIWYTSNIVHYFIVFISYIYNICITSVTSSFPHDIWDHSHGLCRDHHTKVQDLGSQPVFLAVVFSPKKWGDFQENRWNNGDELPGNFRWF